MHGGFNKGPPKGNQNARKHGIYADVLNEEDRGVYDRIEIGSIEDELRILRVRLRRALKAQSRLEEGQDEKQDIAKLRDKLDVNEIETVSLGGKTQTKIKRIAKDYSREIARLIRLIGDLELRKLELDRERPAGSPDEIAAKIRAALDEADSLIPAPPEKTTT